LAVFQVISNLSAAVQPLFAMESWGRFPKERDRLFKLIADSKVINNNNLQCIHFLHFVVKVNHMIYLFLRNVVNQYLFYILLVFSLQRGGVLFISGDVHFGEITRYDCASDYPLFDITSSGLTQSVEEVLPHFLRSLVRFVALLTPSTMRVKGPNCKYKSCVYGKFYLLVFA
jgi:alkaline phosphatase D